LQSETASASFADMVDLIHWHSFDGKMLTPESTIVDLGANRGEFLTKVSNTFGCSNLVAVEPNPELFKELAERSDLIAINAAVGGFRGKTSFSIDPNDLASRVVEGGTGPSTVTVELITLDDVFERAGVTKVDLLKIDIEGQEIPMLDAVSDEVLRNIAQITIEFHDFCGLVPKKEVKRLLARLQGLGFYVARMSRVGHQDTWLVNTKFRPIGLGMKAKIRLLKYSRGFMRVWHKLSKGSNWHLAYD
jgi:FkbM family methyltransferase